jgi:hypothetical protein
MFVFARFGNGTARAIAVVVYPLAIVAATAVSAMQ